MTKEQQNVKDGEYSHLLNSKGKPRKRPLYFVWDEKKDAFLKENYPKYGSEISKDLKCSKGAVRGRARKIGLKLTRDQKTGIYQYHADKNCKINIEEFYNITKPEVAYFLGLIWADGHVQNKKRKHITSISLIETDLNEVLPVFKTFGVWNQYKITKREKNWKQTYVAMLYSRRLSDFLCEHDYLTKSEVSACKILSKIPSHLKKYWFRGIIDGDGHIKSSNHTCTFTLASSYNQNWDFFKKICDELEIEYKTIQREVPKKNGKIHRSSCVIVFNRENVGKLLKYTHGDYVNDKIGISRKALSALEVFDSHYWSVLNNEQSDVSRFMRLAKQDIPLNPTIPTPFIANLRHKLIEEELNEFKIALGWDGEKFDTSKCDLVECADSLIDLLYVVYGGLSALGLKSDELWKEVHKSNLAKFGPGGYRREDGKWMKPPDWKKPDLKTLIEKQKMDSPNTKRNNIGEIIIINKQQK
jgi:predicted HAD superfamily Cof-like phosphohydrolase